ncbi:hypothetical protein N7520_001928 [Penicillium odoratum]|uniref:uncharacterized protein n=1 Tax=Penicillium odoratum TaxID=1167516 RepID=UPI0025491BB7|nr:uncharacterized protein N7520_001928 [Penicillium odoratum]KAJ5778682.1 hypothetical protein N7520_001928 [Penicillium odoratum]
MPTNYEYWHYVWEYGHTFAGLIVLPLTDLWVRKLLAHLKMVPEDSAEQVLQKRLERESRQSLIARLTDFQTTSISVDAALATYISTTQALGMRLSHLEPTEHRIGEALRSFTSNTEALGMRLSHFDNSIEQHMSQFDDNINRRVEEFELRTQQALNERLSRIDQLEISIQQAFIGRLR